jgi:hypothetical protein
MNTNNNIKLTQKAT